MARRRSTSLGCMPAPINQEEYHSKSIRKVDGGYIVSESHSSDGNYTSREYVTQNPNREAKREGSVGQERLSGAISECNK